MLYLKIGQIREQRMSPVIQCSVHSPQDTGQVGSERTEKDGKLRPFLHQVFEQLEEGGQDPVVQSPILSFHSQLPVYLQSTQEPRTKPKGVGGVFERCLIKPPITT